jgi:hypothetical protein
VVSREPALGNAVPPLRQRMMSDILSKTESVLKSWLQCRDVGLTFSITWQWSLMKKMVPLSGRLICMPIRPSVWPGKWCRVMPWQKSKLRSSKVFQFLCESKVLR